MIHLFKRILLFVFAGSLVFSQGNLSIVEGMAAIVDEHAILKSDVAQAVQMALVQQRIDPQKNPEVVMQIQDEVLQSLIDQKIMLEMAKLDSIEVKDKEVEQALDQQIDYMVRQAGGEKQAEEMLGQTLKSLRREFRPDMKDRLITERYQQQMLMGIKINRQEVVEFFNSYQDSLPPFPTQVHLLHVLTTVEAGEESVQSTLEKINSIRDRVLAGESFEDLAVEYSQDPGTAPKGGDLGFVRRGSLVPAFESAAFTLEDMEISEPVKTQFGYHLIQPLSKQGEKINVRHILLTPEITEADETLAYYFATSLKDSINNLDDFIRIAKTHSKDDETRGMGGDLGWVNPQEFPVPEVAQIINYLEMNQCSPPVKTAYGYHLFWIEDTKVGGKADLSRHWQDLERMALEFKKAKWYSDWIARARANFFIKIMD